jgi:hypothetical protein
MTMPFPQQQLRDLKQPPPQRMWHPQQLPLQQQNLPRQPSTTMGNAAMMSFSMKQLDHVYHFELAPKCVPPPRVPTTLVAQMTVMHVFYHL